RRHELGVRVASALIAAQSASVRVLPVDVDAVEDTVPTRVVYEVVARLRERLRVCRGPGEAIGPAPAAERPENLQVRMHLLELAQLVEVPAQRSLIPRVGFAVDTLVRAVEAVVVGVAVTDRTLAVRDVAERVVDVGQLLRGPTRLQVLHMVVAVVDTPLREIPEDLVH